PPFAPHTWPRSYQARATQGDVEATITIRHYGAYQYPAGSILEELTDRVNPLAPGSMGRRQEARAKILRAVLREQVQAALVAAGWEQRWKIPLERDLWLYAGKRQEEVRVASPQNQAEQPTEALGQNRRVLVVPGRAEGRQSAGYSRTITARDVTFTCT